MATTESLAEEWGWVTNWTDLLDQDQVWRNGQGEILLIQDMDPGYRARVHAWIIRQAPHVYDIIGRELLSFGGMLNGEQAGYDFDSMLMQLDDEMDNPEAWLRQQPLLQALSGTSSSDAPAPSRSCFCGGSPEEDHSACWDGL